MDENKKDDNIFMPDNDQPVTYESPKIIKESANDDPETSEKLAEAEPEHVSMYYENNEEHNAYAQQLIKEARERNLRKTLVFSLLGLLLSFFFGFGIVFSIIGFIRANFGLKKANSQTLKWARAIAVLGIVLSAIFIIAMLIFYVYNYYAQLIRDDIIIEEAKKIILSL